METTILINPGAPLGVEMAQVLKDNLSLIPGPVQAA